MKIILTVLFLLVSASAFAGSNPPPVSPATNNAAITNVNSAVKDGKVPEKTDAYTGATRKAKKQK